MSLKQFFIQKLYLFFALTTMITVAIWILGSILDPEASFGYDAFLSPLVYAACCVIPTLVTYSGHELSNREMMVRMVLEWLLIEAVILGFAISSPAIDTDRPTVVLAIAGSVLAIYLVARCLSWLRGLTEARELNEKLLRFQQLDENLSVLEK